MGTLALCFVEIKIRRRRSEEGNFYIILVRGLVGVWRKSK